MSETSRLSAIAALALLLGCAQSPVLSTAAIPPPPSSDPTPITAQAVHALYAVPHREDGTVLDGDHKGAQWTKWAKPDGSMELLAGHGMFADSGKYVIRGNMICTKWGFIDGGRESCVHLVRVSVDEYVTYSPDGSEGSRFKIGPP